MDRIKIAKKLAKEKHYILETDAVSKQFLKKQGLLDTLNSDDEKERIEGWLKYIESKSLKITVDNLEQYFNILYSKDDNLIINTFFNIEFDNNLELTLFYIKLKEKMSSILISKLGKELRTKLELIKLNLKGLSHAHKYRLKQYLLPLNSEELKYSLHIIGLEKKFKNKNDKNVFNYLIDLLIVPRSYVKEEFLNLSPSDQESLLHQNSIS